MELRPNDLQKIHILRDYFAKNGKLPSFREAAKLLEWSSTSSVDRLVRRAPDHLERSVDGHLVPGRFLFAQPVDLSQSNEVDLLKIAHTLVDDPQRSAVFRVNEPSLMHLGVLEGDFVICDRGRDPGKGDLVVVHHDKRYLVRRFELDCLVYISLSTGRNYRPLHVSRSQIKGTVISMYRRVKPSVAA